MQKYLRVALGRFVWEGEVGMAGFGDRTQVCHAVPSDLSTECSALGVRTECRR